MSNPAIPPIGFLGAGKMATALARGWVAARLIPREKIRASDPSAAARKQFGKVLRIAVDQDNLAVVEQSDVIVLAVKPQHVPEVLREVAPVLDNKRHLLISIAAGVTLEQIKELVGHDDRLVRVMPNAPAQVRASASAYAASLTTTEQDRKLVDRLLNAVGRAFAVPEKLLNAVTGLSGSGPAFVAMMIEALSDGGVRMGLPREVATELAAQTVFGSAKMQMDMGLHPGQLKDIVASPGGTTIAGIHELERAGLRAALINAVEAATRKANELGEQ